MSRAKVSTLDGFSAYVESRPRRLGCWRGGNDLQQPVLAWLNRHAIGEVKRIGAETGPEVAMALLASSNHNQVGLSSAWVAEYMVGRTSSSRVSHADLLALFNTAGGYWALKNAIAEVRAGARTFSASGSTVRLAYRSNSEIDALDRVLDVLERVAELDAAPPAPDASIGAWISAHRTVPWDLLPARISDELLAYSSRILDRLPRYLDGLDEIAGITTKAFDAFWVHLMARALHLVLLAWLQVDDPQIIAPRISRTQFVNTIASAMDTAPAEVARIVEILSVDTKRCDDPALTPLVSLGSDFVPMSVPILHTSPHRNLLSIIQRSPNLFGDAGRSLGRAGERETAAVLERLDGDSRVTTRVKVFRRDRTLAGDLDVVACDARARLVVVLEVRWGLSSDGNEEVYRTESGAIEKRANVVRLREAIESGSAMPQWPADWPDVSGFRWRWFLLTRDVLPTKEIHTNGVTIRSVQLLKFVLKPGSQLSEMIVALDTPPSPPAALCATRWDSFRYGDIKIEIELVNA